MHEKLKTKCIFVFQIILISVLNESHWKFAVYKLVFLVLFVKKNISYLRNSGIFNEIQNENALIIAYNSLMIKID